MKITNKALALVCSVIFLLAQFKVTAQETTWSERLGYPKGAKVVVFHVDDVGMSWESNRGAIESMAQGVATSCSMMMPCPWIPGIFRYLKEHPETDAGLHLTLTSEWRDYRWKPVTDSKEVPGLIDPSGMMWKSVEEVAMHAKADEVEKEIRSQIEFSLKLGFRPTHLDSHMGTLFATPAFIQRYIKVGIEYKIPVMFPGGHNTLIADQMRSTAADRQMAIGIGKMLWDAGLPVIDDLHNTSYEVVLPKGTQPTTENLRKHKTEFYKQALRDIRPGITYVIMHCIRPSEHFQNISDSKLIREADFLAMTDPELRAFIQQEGVILTTMRELMKRRQEVK